MGKNVFYTFKKIYCVLTNLLRRVKKQKLFTIIYFDKNACRFGLKIYFYLTNVRQNY